MSLGLLNARLPTSRPSCHVMWPHGEGSQGTGIQENVMSSEMLSADKYLSIVNDLLRFLESRGELKGSSPVRWGAVGNTGYAVRWPPTRLPTGVATLSKVTKSWEFGPKTRRISRNPPKFQQV